MPDEHGLGYVVRDIYVYLAVHEDGDEGVVAMRMGSAWIPLVAADPIRLAQLRPIAEATARTTGKSIRLVRFTTREEVETIDP
jgi:hypothetical protein